MQLQSMRQAFGFRIGRIVRLVLFSVIMLSSLAPRRVVACEEDPETIWDALGDFFSGLADLIASAIDFIFSFGSSDGSTFEENGAGWDDWDFWDEFPTFVDDYYGTGTYSSSQCGINPFTPHDGNVRRQIDDLLAADKNALSWKRTHNSLPRRSAIHDAFGTAGNWRHSWQYDLVSELDGVNGGTVYQFIYPSGYRAALKPNSSGELVAGKGFPERARMVDGRMEVTTSGEAKVLFTRRIDNAGNEKYDPVAVIRANGDTVSFSYDDQHRLHEINNSRGNWLRLSHKEFNVGVQQIMQIGRSSAVPAASRWLEIAVPRDSRIDASLLLVRFHQGASVDEVQFFAEGSSTPLEGTSFSPASSSAFDGDLGTAFSSPTKATSCGIRLAKGQSARIDRVRIKATDGFENKLVDVQVLAGRSQPTHVKISGITKVESDDGRSVEYEYTTQRETSGDYLALSGVRYGDSTKASYRYSKSTIPGNQPLLLEADDPRYPGPAKHIAYSYYDSELDGRGHGTIKAEVNPETGKAWTELLFDANDPLKRIVVYSDDRVHTFRLTNDGTNRIAEKIDAYGRKTAYEYAPGTFGPAIAMVDYAGRRTERQRDDRGRTINFTDPSGRTGLIERDSGSRIQRMVDGKGKVATFKRNGVGKIMAVEYNGQSLAFTRESVTGRITAVNALGRKISAEYDEKGRLSTLKNGSNIVKKVTYSEYGFISSVTDAAGRITRFERDECGRATAVVDAAGRRRTINRDQYGRKISETQHDGKMTSYEYDILGRMTKQTDAQGHATRFEYSDYPGGCPSCTLSQKPTKITYHDGTITEQLYDVEGRLLARSTAVGTANESTTTYGYDNDGNVIAVTDPLGNVTRYNHDSEGRVVSSIEPTGAKTVWSYDNRGNNTAITLPTGAVTKLAYDDQDRVVQVTGPDGTVTTSSYDGLGNLVREVDAAGNETNYVFDGKLCIKKIYSNGKTESWKYDSIGRMIESVNTDGLVTVTLYDLTSQPLEIKKAGSTQTSITKYAYDAIGRRTSVTDAAGNVTKWTYDKNGNINSEVRPDNASAYFNYDDRGQKTSSADFMGRVTKYTYDAPGNLVAMQDANGNIHRFSYDTMRRLTEIKYPDGTSETWNYDASGQLTRYTTRSKQTMDNTYSGSGRLLHSKWSPQRVGMDVDNKYNDGGQLVVSDNGLVKREWSYDTYGRISTEVTDATRIGGTRRSVSYRYDHLGFKKGIVYPDGHVVTYARDQNGRLLGVFDAQMGVVAEFSYDEFSKPSKISRPNGVVTSYRFSPTGQMVEVDHKAKDQKTIGYARYDLDAVGRFTSELNEGNVRKMYEYDTAGQLIIATNGRNVGETEVFAYDPVGNRAQMTANGKSRKHVLYKTNVTDQYTEARFASDVHNTTDVLDLTYDGNGNSSKTTSGTIEYDYLSRPVSFEFAGGVSGSRERVELFYDPNGRCVVRKLFVRQETGELGLDTSRSLELSYDNEWNVLCDRSLSGITFNTYIHGEDKDQVLAVMGVAGTRYPLANAIGSAIAVTDSNGSVITRVRYSAYGEPMLLDETGNEKGYAHDQYRFLFTGREWLQECGVYDYRNRVYIPEVGRFAQADPVRSVVWEPGLYKYAGNRPNQLTDPFGLTVLSCFSSAVKGFSASDLNFAVATVVAEAKNNWDDQYSVATVLLNRLNCYGIPGGPKSTFTGVATALNQFQAVTGFGGLGSPKFRKTTSDCSHTSGEVSEYSSACNAMTALMGDSSGYGAHYTYNRFRGPASSHPSGAVQATSGGNWFWTDSSIHP